MHTTTSHSGGNYFKLSVFANKCDVFPYGHILIIIHMIKILINTIIIKILIKDTIKMAIISTEGALRRPMTNDNRPIRPSKPREN